MNQKEADQLLYYTLHIGEQMLKCGAEVNRVEDSISRICTAYGIKRVDVLTITASIVVTIYDDDFGSITQTRRIQGQSTHLNKLNKLNHLSRTICATTPDFSFIKHELEQINEIANYPFWIQVISYGIISGSFSLFFGGNYRDMLVSAVIGIFLKYVETVFRKFRIYNFFVVFICSAFGGLMAYLSVRAGLGSHADKINIGNIMLLIPGIPLTNAIRDMFQGDTISGLLRFAEALLLAVCVAVGFAAAAVLIHI